MRETGRGRRTDKRNVPGGGNDAKNKADIQPTARRKHLQYPFLPAHLHFRYPVSLSPEPTRFTTPPHVVSVITTTQDKNVIGVFTATQHEHRHAAQHTVDRQKANAICMHMNQENEPPAKVKNGNQTNSSITNTPTFISVIRSCCQVVHITNMQSDQVF